MLISQGEIYWIQPEDLRPSVEGGLSQMSVVIISQIASVDKAALGEKVGSLSSERVTQILDGLRFVQRAFFER